MKNQIRFKNFEPDFGLRLQANLASASTPTTALEQVEEQLMSLIADRKSRRGGPLPPSTPPVFYPALAVS
jgi:hypothetical protein